MNFLKLKDVTVRADAVVAYGGVTIPGTLQTPEFFAISIWIANAKEPIVATYISEEERNVDLEIIDNKLNAQA